MLSVLLQQMNTIKVPRSNLKKHCLYSPVLSKKSAMLPNDQTAILEVLKEVIFKTTVRRRQREI